MSGLVREAARLHIRSLVVARTISVAFAGRDIHEIIDQYILRTCTHIFTISVDLCMQRQKCRLGYPHSCQVVGSPHTVRAGCLRRRGGPPCETFTIARSTDDGGPRPLRSAGQPQGLPGLTQHEWAQVQIGDKLLRFLLEVLLALAAYG